MAVIPELHAAACHERTRGSSSPRPRSDCRSGDSYVDRFGAIDEWNGLYAEDDWRPGETTPGELQRHHFNGLFLDVHRVRHRLSHGENLVELADTVRRSLKWYGSLWTRMYKYIRVIASAKQRLLRFCKASKARRTGLLDGMLQACGGLWGGHGHGGAAAVLQCSCDCVWVKSKSISRINEVSCPRTVIGGRTVRCARAVRKVGWFSTAGSHGSQGPEVCTPDAVVNGSCTLL